jgi:hypothetical protein
MRASLLSLIFAVGCSGGNFTVASTTEDGATEDAAISDTSTTLDSASDTGAVAVDTGSTGDSNASDVIVAETGGKTCSTSEECPGINQWCKHAACGDSMGICTPLTTPGPYYEPVCGCDGVTYWNKAHAESYSVTPMHAGPCTAMEAKGCATGGCDLCVQEVPGSLTCAAGTIPGRCWRAPAGTLCTSTMAGPSVGTCDGKCETMCQAVKDKAVFYAKACTPG